MDKKQKDSPGIVYLSKIPPSMNPLKIRTLLSQFGKIGRVYLQAEGKVSAYLFISMFTFFFCLYHDQRFDQAAILQSRLMLTTISDKTFRGY